VSSCEHDNGKSVSIAAQELTEHLSNYTVTCGYYYTSPCLLMLHFTHLWALFPSTQSGLWLPFPVHPPTLRPSARPPVAAHCVEVYVGRVAFFSLLSFMITEPMLAATWTDVGISIQQCFSRYYNIDLSRNTATLQQRFISFFYEVLFVENKTWQIDSPTASWDTLRLLRTLYFMGKYHNRYVFLIEKC